MTFKGPAGYTKLPDRASISLIKILNIMLQCFSEKASVHMAVKGASVSRALLGRL